MNGTRIRLVHGPNSYDVSQWQEHWKDFAFERDVPESESDHWDWLGKSLFVGHVGLGIEFLIVAAADRVDERCHGLMKLVWPKGSRLASGRDVLYVDYLEIAPWNRWDYRDREVRGLGFAMMVHAIGLSQELGFEGRVALCSLPQAQAFYRKIPMSELGVGEGHDAELPYFELDSETAQGILKRF